MSRYCWVYVGNTVLFVGGYARAKSVYFANRHEHGDNVHLCYTTRKEWRDEALADLSQVES